MAFLLLAVGEPDNGGIVSYLAVDEVFSGDSPIPVQEQQTLPLAWGEFSWQPVWLSMFLSGVVNLILVGLEKPLEEEVTLRAFT